MTDPIFKYPPKTFDGENGESDDVELFLKNDGTTKLGGTVPLPFQITPVDLVGSDETTWIKLATSQGGLNAAIAGDPLDVIDMDPGDFIVFWMRMTVPPSTIEENKQDFRLRITANSIPV